MVQSHIHLSLWFVEEGSPFDHALRNDQWTAQLHDHKVLGYLGVYVDDLLIAGRRSLSDSLIAAVQQIWKTSTPEHLGPDPDCVSALRFLGMNLEHVDNVRSEELSLPEGTILVNQMEYIVEVLMKFEPSLQLKTRTTPRNQESFTTRTKSTSRTPTSEEHAAYLDALHALFIDELIEIDAAHKTPNVHYNSESDVINLPAIVGCLNWMAQRARPDTAWPTSRAASLISHDPDTCFIRVKNVCQYLHHTLGSALRYVPMPSKTKHKLWVMGDASFAPTGDQSQQGLIVYHGITSQKKHGGNLVQSRSSRQPDCQVHL